MFFYLSKIFGFFAIPSNFIILLGIAGALLLRTRFARMGRRLSVASLMVLAIIGFSPLGNALIIPLEERFPTWDYGRGSPDGLVVLGGAISPDVSAVRDEPALNEAAERMTAVVELARRFPNMRILFSGGVGELIYLAPPEAEFALKQFERLGIARERIVAEDKSRNTVENALFSLQLAKPEPGQRWLLVTSAYHMPRAIGVFRKIGFNVEAHPVDWRTRGPEDVLRPFPTLGDGLRRTDTAVREWVGLAIYWLTGRSSELFPGPNVTGAADLKFLHHVPQSHSGTSNPKAALES